MSARVLVKPRTFSRTTYRGLRAMGLSRALALQACWYGATAEVVNR